MQRVAVALIGFLVVAGLHREAMAKTAVDLVLALGIDVSRSIDYEEGQLQRQGYIQAFRDKQVINAIKSGMLGRIAVGYYEWAGDGLTRVVKDWTLIDSEASALAFADALDTKPPEPASRTSISGAINFAVPWLTQNDFEGTRRVLDISGDGPNNSGELVNVARDRAIAAGITINGLPIMDQGSGFYGARYNIPNLDLFYRDCVIGGPGAFIVVAKGFESFARAVRRKLLLEISGYTPPRAVERIYKAQQVVPPPRVPPPCDIGEQIMRSRDDF